MFDYIVVGAGSAGCVLANRLTADPRIRVLLVEAGGRDRNPLFRVPKGFGKLFDNPRVAWQFPTRPFGPNKQREIWPRGKVLGGSSSINGMVYNRGQRADYDELVRLGNPGWGWETLLPIFRSIEDHAMGASDSRGSGGPLHVSDPRDPDPLCEEMISAGTAVGLTRMPDINETDDERIGHTVSTIKEGRRVSAAAAFLHPVRQRPNLTVVTRTTVTGLVFDGDKAVGVRARRPAGGQAEYRASREVVLALGSLHTPKILQLSGIGPADVLRSAGVQVRLGRPNVGARLREHRCLSLKFRLTENLGYNRLLSTSAGQAVTAAKYMMNHKGPLAAPAYDVIAFIKSRPDVPRPDAQLLMGPWSVRPYRAGEKVAVEREPGVQVIGNVLRPEAEGSLAITSADPDAPVDIDPNYFGSEHDRRVGVDLFRRMRDLFAQEPIVRRLAGETFPGADVRSDDDLIDAALDQGYCGYHTIGTCAMGPDEDDVVDSQLRVRGVDNLRVVDCSVLPIMVSGNLNGPIMAMAWHAADLILDRG